MVRVGIKDEECVDSYSHRKLITGVIWLVHRRLIRYEPVRLRSWQRSAGKMTSRARVLAVAGLAGVCLAACGVADGAASGGPGRPGWRVVARVAAPGRQLVLLSADAPSPGDAWALGFSVAGENLDLAVPVLAHWNGRDWKRLGLPSGVRRKFAVLDPFDISVRVSPGSGIWLFGSNWVRMTGNGWRWGSLPSPGRGWAVSTDDAVVLRRDDVWAFGTALRGSAYRPYAAQYDGRRWRLSAIPGIRQVASASAISPNDIWAVTGIPAVELNTAPTSTAAVVHWNGSRWTPVAIPAELARHGHLTSIIARNDHDVWIAGALSHGTGALSPATAHWDGRRWDVARLRIVGPRRNYAVSSMDADGNRGAWATGVCVTCSKPVPAIIWHLTGQRWSAPMTNYAGRHATAFALAQVVRTSSVWGVGSIQTNSITYGLIILYGHMPR